MRTRPLTILILALYAACRLALPAAPPSTALTYQGRLTEGTNMANGLYDLQFALYDALDGGNLVAGPVTNSLTSVTDGLFTVAVDFGLSVFTGDARWLEISARTNGSVEGFTPLAPRQPLGSVPYALQALSAGSLAVGLTISEQPSTNAVSVNDDLLINATNNGAGTWTAKRATVGSVLGSLNATLVSAALSNAAVSVGSTDVPTDYYNTWSNIVIGTDRAGGGPGGDILFPDLSGVAWQSGAAIYDWAEHGWLGPAGASQPLNELQILANWRAALAAYSGFTFYPDSGLGPGFQMGGTGYFGDSFWFQYNTTPGSPGLGYSKLVSFITQSSTSNVTGYASIRGVANSYNSDRAMLRFYSGPRHALDNSAVGDGVELGGTTGNGWELRGPLIQEQKQVSGSSSCALDFSAAYCVTISAIASNLNFFTVNRQAATTNYEHRIFVIRSGLAAISATWPAWAWLTSVPTNFGPAQVLRLSLESVGAGETNILASASLGADPTAIPYDPAATDFFSRANINTLPEQVALNAFVVALKQNNLWTNLHAVYPFVGGTAGSHAVNLMSTDYAITWYGNITHDANGITGDGLTGYGDTGYSPTNGLMTTSSAHFSVYQRLAPNTFYPAMPGDTNESGWFIGSSGTETSWNSIGNRVSSDGQWNSLAISGPNSALGAYPDLMGNYYAGLDLLNRTNATGIVVYQPNSPVFVQDPGFDSTIPANAGNFTILKGGYYDDECSGGNVTFVSIGSGLDAQQANALIAAVNALQTALGRNAAGQ